MEVQSRLKVHGDVVTVSRPVVIAKHVAREVPALQEPGKHFCLLVSPLGKLWVYTFKDYLHIIRTDFQFLQRFLSF